MMNYLPNYLRCSAIIRLTPRGSVTMISVEGGFIPHRGQQKWYTSVIGLGGDASV